MQIMHVTLGRAERKPAAMRIGCLGVQAACRNASIGSPRISESCPRVGHSGLELAVRPLGAFQKLALWLLRDARDSARLLDSFDAWIPAMLELDRTRSGRDSLGVLITYMFQMIDPVNQEQLHAKIRELGPRRE